MTMASNRNIRRRSCDGKGKYRSLELAIAEAAFWSMKQAEPLRAYPCTRSG
jgi:hypothetical protein